MFINDDTLYNVLTTKVITRCDNRTLVVPGDPDNSALYLALNGTCGTVGQMPHTCYDSPDEAYNKCSSYDDRERLRQWIAAGAPQ